MHDKYATETIGFGLRLSSPRGMRASGKRSKYRRVPAIYFVLAVLVCIVCYVFATTINTGSVAQQALASHPPIPLQSFTYTLVPGDTLQTLTAAFGVPLATLQSINHLPSGASPLTGQRLLIPWVSQGYQLLNSYPSGTRHLIETTALRFHVDAALALAIAWQESRAHQEAVSSRQAMGIMQVEPATGEQVGRQLGSTIDLGNAYDNVTAGVYWLGYLLRYYHGDTQQAVAAYYEGQSNLAMYGYFPDARQYTLSVLRFRMAFASH